jgi:hypothetical protein
MAKLNNIDLPNSMRYPPFVQEKRYSIVPTITGAIVQQPAAGIIHGDGLLEWTMELLCYEELCTMYYFYGLPGPLDFEGQYGEEYVVDFINMRTTAIGGGKFNINGTFVVRCITTDICVGVPYY